MPADRQMAIDLIDEACAAGARQARACAVLELDVRTLGRWKRQRHEEQRLVDRRREAAAERVPANKLSPEERARVLSVCNEPAYRSLPPSQIVPRLADEGEYLASESTFYRVLHEADQQHRRGRGQVPRMVPKPEGYKAEAPNQVWSWDITYLAASIRGAFYRLYLVEDIFSRKIVGWEVHEQETSEHAAVLIRKSCLAEGIHENGLVLHSDNGGPMKGATMLATLQRLGVVPSFGRPSVSDDNPYSESLFRTLKYTPAYPNKPFESLSAAREWVHHFVQWYNDEHRHSGICYVTPGQRHRGEDIAILDERKRLYEAAKAAHPRRWSGDTRDWTPVGEVWLNPPKEQQDRVSEQEKVA
jgi:transposase InsO family protein